MRQDKQMDGQASRKEDNTMQRQSNFKEAGRSGKQNRQAERASRKDKLAERIGGQAARVAWCGQAKGAGRWSRASE